MDSLDHEIINTYKQTKSIKLTQLRLGLSYYKISKVLKAYNIETSKTGPRIRHRFYNCLVKWLHEHPGTVLPRKPKKIQELTGCSSDSIRAFLYRQRKRTRNFAKRLHQNGLLKKIKKFKDINGQIISYSMIKSYKVIKVDSLNSEILLKVKLKAIKNKNYFIKLNIKEYI